jgi:hypothetical protein
MSNPEIFQMMIKAQCDSKDALNDAEAGEDYAEFILFGMKESASSFPTDARYLALGAGQAQAELALAKKLGIAEQNVTLLDKAFSNRARNRFKKIAFSGKRIETDIFSYLDSSSVEKYDLVTAIGIEYLLTEDTTLERLITGLSAKLNANGIVFISPSSPTRDMIPTWKSNNFTPLLPDTTFLDLYQKTPIRKPPLS